MKPYFAKYLPIEGEIKEGDKVQLPKAGNFTIVDAIVSNGKIGWNTKAGHVYFYADSKVAKLFLCSRDIQVGDKVKSFNYPEQLEREVVNLRTSKKLVGAKDHSEIYHLADIQYPNEVNTAAVSNFFKVIGEILTPGITENQQFTEKEIEFLTIGGIIP